MTEADAALARIGEIAREGAEPAPRAFGFMDDGWARAGLEEELREAAEALRAFVRTEDKRVGTVVTDWTGDVYCVCGRRSGRGIWSGFRGILRCGCGWGLCWRRR